MRSLVDELANSLDCRMSHRLKAVSRESGKWLLTGTVEDEHEESTFSCGDYDFLVLNMPPAQAAALRPFAGLSELILRPCVALLLAFQDRVSLDFDGVILEDRILSWVARDSSKPGRNPGERWVIHASPDWSEEYLQKPEDEVERLLTERFATVFGITLPPISFRKLHKWRFALPVSPPAWGSILDREAGLAYCGDWCVAARVEGAYLSGLHAAEQIIGAQSS
jgi:predicted NAD/FAD-dependent oxidoreductase